MSFWSKNQPDKSISLEKSGENSSFVNDEVVFKAEL